MRLWLGIEPYKLKPVRILVDLDELIDVPIHHPLRCHSKEGEGIIHRHS